MGVKGKSITYKPEEIVVIGGGLGGCLSALFAARVKDEQGRPQYHVTLLEGNHHILSGASVVAARLHLGGEYPKDLITATDCLWGAVLWKLIFPQEGLFTKQNPIRFFIANATQQKGEVTLGQYEAQYKKVRDQYESLINSIARKVTTNPLAASRLGVEIPPLVPLPEKSRKRQQERQRKQHENAIEKQVEQILFGDPKDFYHSLKSSDLKLFGAHMAGGFATKEPGLDIVGYLSSIEPALKEAGVDIVTEARVSYIDANAGHTGYAVHCDNGKVFSAEQLIQASWQGGFNLDAPHRRPEKHKKVQVYRRAMAIVDTHNIDKKDLPSPSFVLKDEAGGMFSPINEDVAFVYCPMKGLGHLDHVELDSSNPAKRTVPDEWKKPLSDEEKKSLLERYKEKLVNGPFPFLKDAEFLSVMVRPTLNFDNDIDRRRHEPTEEIAPGYHALYPSKLTLAPASAIEAVQNLRQRSLCKQKGDPAAPLEQNTALNRAFMVLLQDRQGVYDLRNTLKFNDRDYIYPFIQQREPELGIAFANILKKRVPLYGPLHPEEPDDTRPRTQSSVVKNRSFGLGFGPAKVSVYTEDGPKTGLLFDKDPQNNNAICGQIASWLQSPQEQPLADVIGAEKLAPALYNRLIHADQLDLIHFMSEPNKLMPNDNARALLFGRENLARFPEDAWQIIKKSRSGLPSLEKLRSLNSLEELPSALPKQEIMAAMLPILFGTLNPFEQALVAQDMAIGLHAMGEDRRFFAPLADPDVNRLIVKGMDEVLMAKRIVNNAGRTLQVELQSSEDPKPAALSIQFQGKIFYPVQFHFHRTRSLVTDDDGNIKTDATGKALSEAGVKNKASKQDGEFEFKLYRSRAHEEACKHGEPDPNHQNDVVGELHSIFMTEQDPITKHRTALALCAHVKLGEENKAMAPYINSLKHHNRELKEGDSINRDDLPFNALACFNYGKFNQGELPEAPFASLHMGSFESKNGRVVLKDGSDIFYRGVHVVHLPEEQAVTINLQQFQALEKAQPVLKALPNELSVLPYGRATSSSAIKR